MYKLRISRGRTINQGNYESYRFDVSIEDEFDEAVSIESAYQSVSADVSKLVRFEEKNAH